MDTVITNIESKFYTRQVTFADEHLFADCAPVFTEDKLRLKIGGAVATLSKGGVCRTSGIRTRSEAKRLADKIVERLSRNGAAVTVKNFTIDHVTATFTTGKPIALANIMAKLGADMGPDGHSVMVDNGLYKACVYDSGTVIAGGFPNEECAKAMMLDLYIRLIY